MNELSTWQRQLFIAAQYLADDRLPFMRLPGCVGVPCIGRAFFSANDDWF